MEGIEYDDSFNTIKELLYSLINYEIKERVEMEIKNLTFTTQSDDFNMKSLIKFILPFLFKEELEVNNLDLSYEELIILQLKIINKISHNSNKPIFVISNIPCITKEILEELNILNVRG